MLIAVQEVICSVAEANNMFSTWAVVRGSAFTNSEEGDRDDDRAMQIEIEKKAHRHYSLSSPTSCLS